MTAKTSLATMRNGTHRGAGRPVTTHMTARPATAHTRPGACLNKACDDNTYGHDNETAAAKAVDGHNAWLPRMQRTAAPAPKTARPCSEAQ